MKKTTLILSFILTLTLCACSDSGSDSDKPVATPAPDVTVSSQAESSSENESSSEEESSDDESSKEKTFLETLDELSEDEYDKWVNYEEEFETTEEFLSSGFIEKYYMGIDFGNDRIIPEYDDSVKAFNVYAHIGNYWLGFGYNDKTYGICVDVLDHFDSTEDLYDHFARRMPEEAKYDKENDLVILSDKTSGNVSVEKLTPSGKLYDVFCWKQGDATIDEIIEFSKHLKF